MVKAINFLLKLLIVIATFVYTGLSVFIASFSSFSTGLFGASNTDTELLAGKIMMLFSLLMAILALFVFQKKNGRYIIGLFISTIVIYFAFAVIDGFGNEFDTFVILYLVFLLVLYGLIRFTHSGLKN